MIDKKGIFSFLAITFGVTYALEIGLIASGFRFVGMESAAGQYLFLPIMVTPAIGALITARFVTHEGYAKLGLRFGPWKEYLKVGLLIPALFVLIYALTWALGLAQPDWYFTYFTGLFSATGTPPPEMPAPWILLPVFFVITLTVGTVFNWLFCTGEELGWRGYLLPKLMPLGKPRAYLLLGVIWSAWHWPLVLVGFVYTQPFTILPFVLFTLLTLLFGIYLNELRLKHDSALLAGWAHGVFNTQKLGMWYLLFPNGNLLLGGYAGVVGLVVWGALAWWSLRQESQAVKKLALAR